MKSPWISLFSASLSLTLTGCCCGLVDLSDFLPSGEEAEPSADTPGVELGVAVYPDKTPEAQATRYAWRNGNKEPSVYRVGYALSKDEQAAVDRAQSDLVEAVNFRDRGGGKFSWTPPKGCGPHMQCIFEDLAKHSKPDIDPLVALFRAQIKKENLDTTESVELVMTFVQAIPYEIPEGRPFGLLPPALVAAQKKGDCDSKALLLHMLLEALGVDSVLLTSEAHLHSMLAVAVPAQGTKITYEGRDYAFVETTAKGAPLGWISKKMLTPNDWIVVPVKVRMLEKPTKHDVAEGKAEPDDKPRKKPRRQ